MVGAVREIRRYGFSGKLALSILTDFAELSVYDCTARPYRTDRASRSRITYFPVLGLQTLWPDRR